MITPTADEEKNETDEFDGAPPIVETPFEAWLGLLSGPAVFLFNLLSSFLVLPWVAATGEYLAIYLSCGASMTLVGISGWFSYRVWQQPANPPQQQFAGFMGVLVSTFFIFALIAVWIPHAMLDS
jgi:hypothetical protein